MARRRGRRRRRWWRWRAVLGLALALLAVWWWITARRAEAPAPPATVPGARMLGQPPGAEEITTHEKEELQRILRERAGGGAKAE